jgi:uncharacterized protein (TIGR02646 family)
MRFIEKGPEPESLRAWKLSGVRVGNDAWAPTYETLQNPEKGDVKRSLIAEQRGVCCYCEQRLVEADSHIEHLEPQSSPRGKTMTVDYGNLLCSCLREKDPGKPYCCGQARGDWNGPDFIRPLEPDCAAHFAYGSDGSILPSDKNDRRAIETIDHLKLSDYLLTQMRKKALDAFFDAAVDLDPTEQHTLASAFALPNQDGVFDPGFPTLFEYLFLRN